VLLFIISIIISEILAGSNNKVAQKKVEDGTAKEAASNGREGFVWRNCLEYRE
jgi:hypothetical protein